MAIETAEDLAETITRARLGSEGRVARAAKLELLEEIRLGANAELKGKGLSLSPAEAVANAYQASVIKYGAAKEPG